MDFRLLIIADVHHAAAGAAPSHPRRRVELAAELLRRAIEDTKHRFCETGGAIDAIALMGDLLDDGSQSNPASQANLEQLRDVLAAAAPEVPLLVVPGNHDGDAERMLRTFGSARGCTRSARTGSWSLPTATAGRLLHAVGG